MNEAGSASEPLLLFESSTVLELLIVFQTKTPAHMQAPFVARDSMFGPNGMGLKKMVNIFSDPKVCSIPSEFD